MSDVSDRLNAALEGRYRVERQLGEGGMATVYLADDLRHERKVALKVLKPELAAVVGAERFLAEIKTTANLQHPHILPLFDSGEADGFLFYVMPCVEGESLRDRLNRDHQLPVVEAVRIASDVAEALAYAHGHGVIHRDIKPANILIHSGRPVISDFGIALAVGAAGGGRLTETGLSLGTPHYMSPEQATGDQSVGPATDIYALGCVLYEMLVGEPPYTGSTPQAVLGKIITGEFDPVTKHRKTVPANVEATIRRALEKVPADRFSNVAEFAAALADPGFKHGERAVGGVTVGVGRWKQLTMVFAALFILVSAITGWSLLRPSSIGSLPQRLSINVPADRPVALNCSACRFLAISPNGMDVVYVARDPENPAPNSRRLELRSLIDRSVRYLPGTEAARQPFFSPDGRWVGFFAGPGEVKKLSLDGGTPLTLASGATAINAFGTWTDADEIIFAGNTTEGLRRVSAEGGSSEQVTTVESGRGEVGHWYPEYVSGTRTVLFTVRGRAETDRHIEAVNLDTGERQVVVENGDHARYLASGHLLYQRAVDQALVVAPFEVGRLALTGPAVPVADEVRTDPGGRVRQLAVSKTGTLAYVPLLNDATTLGIVDRDGTFEALAVAEQLLDDPRVSPDGRYVGFNARIGGGSQVFLHDVIRGTTDRHTQNGSNQGVAWHPNGRELTITSTRQSGSGIYITDLSGTEQLLVPRGAAQIQRNASWSPDGAVLAYTVQNGTQHDIWVITRDDQSSAEPLIDGPTSEHSPRFSPDGRWLAYISDEPGQREVYLRRYPNGERLRVSTEGGNGSVWSPDGRELFFDGPHEGERRMMSVSVTPDGETLQLGTPTPLFDMAVQGASESFVYRGGNNGGIGYDVFPDGRRFVIVRRSVTPALEIVLVQNFFEELKRLVPN